MEELRDQLAKALQVKDEFQSKSDELEKLKLSLFEKDSELAAMKASLAEATEDSVNTSAFGARLDSQSAEMELQTAKSQEMSGRMSQIKEQAENAAQEETIKEQQWMAEKIELQNATEEWKKKAQTWEEEILNHKMLKYEKELSELRAQLEARGDSFSSGVDVDMVVDDAVNNQVPPTIVQEDTKSNDVDDNGDEEDEGWGDEGWSDDEDI